MRFCQLLLCATAIRRSTTGGGRILQRTADRVGKRVGVGRHLDDLAVLGVEAPDLRQIGRHDRNAHHQVLVQLRRIDVRRVVAQRYGTIPTSNPFT